MKKILTLAVMALLLGGLSFSANAQVKVSKSKDAKTAKTATVKKDSAKKEAVKKDAGTTKKVDWNKELKSFEQAVDQCLTLFKSVQETGGKDEKIVKNYNAALEKAENLKTKIDKAKKELDRTQADRFNKACQKLSQVYTKG